MNSSSEGVRVKAEHESTGMVSGFVLRWEYVEVLFYNILGEIESKSEEGIEDAGSFRKK